MTTGAYLTTPQKLAPNSQESEEAVLGSILINPDVLPVVSDFLRAEDFYYMHHRFVWEGLLGVHERGEAIDSLTVVEDLRYRRDRDGQTYLDKIGGPAFITYLINNTPTHIHVETYARMVERLGVRRRLLDAASAIAKTALADDIELEEVISRAEQTLLTVTRRKVDGGLMSIGQIAREYYERLGELYYNREAGLGLPTGFTDLDRLLGGMHKNDLIIVAARPGVGKTSFMLSVIMNAARVMTASKVRIALFSMEMSREQLMQRIFSLETGINNTALKLGNLDDSQFERVAEAWVRIDNLHIYIDDTPGQTPNQIHTKSKALQAEYGLDLIVVDYLQLMSAGRKTDNRQQEVSVIARELKHLAMDLKVPVLSAAQLSRATEQRSDKRPILSDLRESGGIENDADIVMFIYREEMYDPNTLYPNQAEIIVEKHRNGPTGTINLWFQKELTQFKNMRRNTIDLRVLADPSHRDY